MVLNLVVKVLYELIAKILNGNYRAPKSDKKLKPLARLMFFVQNTLCKRACGKYNLNAGIASATLSFRSQTKNESRCRGLFFLCKILYASELAENFAQKKPKPPGLSFSPLVTAQG